MGSWHSLGAGEEDTLRLGPQSCKAWLGGSTYRDSGSKDLGASGPPKRPGTGKQNLGLGGSEGRRALSPREQSWGHSIPGSLMRKGTGCRAAGGI